MQLQPHQNKRIKTKQIAAIKFENLKRSVNKQLPTPEKKTKTNPLSPRFCAQNTHKTQQTNADTKGKHIQMNIHLKSLRPRERER